MKTVVSLASYNFLPAKTGGQKNIAYFYKYFSRYVRVVALTTKDNDNDFAEGYDTIKLWSLSKLRYVNPFYFFHIRRIIKNERATHLLIEHPYLGWLAILLKKAIGVKLIVHSHNIESLRFKSLNKWWWKFLWYYEKWVHRSADCSFFIQDDDMHYAFDHYKLSPGSSMVVTFGIERNVPPSEEEINKAREIVRRLLGLNVSEKLLLFVGAFNYYPNITALENIERELLPRLKKQNFAFKIVICGAGLAERKSPSNDILYAGYVEDIEQYFQATDVFINPVIDGGGIKTKLVEALSNNANAVSTLTGAIGVNARLCNKKLSIVADNDWDDFTKAIIAMSDVRSTIPPAYFEHFFWGYNTKEAAEFINA